VQVVAV
jgi:CheY-like chemotaxis protein/mono/diheme cytochrome c family protein